MATADVTVMPPISGLYNCLTLDDMKRSTTTHNGLPRINNGMHIDKCHLKSLVAIIAKHELLDKLGVNVLHMHEPLSNGQFKLETQLETMPGKWIKPVTIHPALDLNNIHGLLYRVVLGENRLVPYEFGTGPCPVSKSHVVQVHNCVNEVVSYLAEYDLVDTIALKLKDSQPDEGTVEVEVDQHGTVVLPKAMVNLTEPVPTGWPDVSNPFDPDGPGPNEHWEPAKVGTKETHKVFIKRMVENEKDLLGVLVDLGIIKA